VNTYTVKLMMAEVRNDAGRKVAVQPIYVKAQGRTPQEAVERITAAFGSALTIGMQKLMDHAKAEAADVAAAAAGEL